MKGRTKTELPTFEFSILLALVLIGWAAYRLIQIVPETDHSPKQYGEWSDEFNGIAEVVQTTMTELDGSLTNLLQRKEGANAEHFQHRAQEFSQWMRAEQSRLSQLEKESPSESGSTNQVLLTQQKMLTLFAQIGVDFSNYLDTANYLLKNAGQPLIAERLAVQDRASRALASQLLNRAEQARDHADDMSMALAGAEDTGRMMQERIRRARFADLLALLAMCFLLIFAVYRRKLARERALVREHGSQFVEQRAKLEKLAHFGEFARELAHEIKQPLTAINARLYTLQKTLTAESNAHKDALVIRNEINRLDRIVKDFLALARPTDPRLAPLDATDVLDEIRDLMTPQFATESITLKYECRHDLRILGDAEQLKQVLINLVKNAGESLEREGTVTLRGQKGQRHLKNGSADAVIIEVEDTGPGIPSEIQSKIFDPFFSTKGDGTGLGLAIAARIVDKHGGILEFDTEPGKGTVFRIVLPACQKEHMA